MRYGENLARRNTTSYQRVPKRSGRCDEQPSETMHGKVDPVHEPGLPSHSTPQFVDGECMNSRDHWRTARQQNGETAVEIAADAMSMDPITTESIRQPYDASDSSQIARKTTTDDVGHDARRNQPLMQRTGLKKCYRCLDAPFRQPLQ